MSDTTYTTTGNFPVVDITHHSKRTQEGNLKMQSERIYGCTNVEDANNIEVSAPRAVTIENAIDFYSKATTTDVQLAKLYSATSLWLEDYLKLKSVKSGILAKEQTSEEISKIVEEELKEPQNEGE